MFKDVHMSHLTGTATIVENNWFDDQVVWDRERRTIGQMFFKPYESKKEFIFCARNTFQPIAFIGFALISPIVLVSTPIVFGVATLGCLAISAINKLLGDDETAWWALNLAEEICSRFCQFLVNLVLVPVTALAMITRGISTGLQAARICEFDAPDDGSDDELEDSGLSVLP